MPKEPTMKSKRPNEVGANYAAAVVRGSRANKTHKKKNQRENILVHAPSLPRKQWWEIWQETQDVQTFFCDQDVNIYDKMYSATDKFNKGRTWPATVTQVRARWDQFQVYVGLLTNASDDEFDRLTAFVQDPAKHVQIYLSSYMINKGLHFTPYFCDIIPRLLSFYITFLLTNKVLPEKESNLRYALEITELAKMELPLFRQIGHACPDHLNLACKELFSAELQCVKMNSMKTDPDNKENVGGASPAPSPASRPESESASTPTQALDRDGDSEMKENAATVTKNKKRNRKSKGKRRQVLDKIKTEETEDGLQASAEDENRQDGWATGTGTGGWSTSDGIASWGAGAGETNNSGAGNVATGGWGDSSFDCGSSWGWGDSHQQESKVPNPWGADAPSGTSTSAGGFEMFTTPTPPSSFVPTSIIGPNGLPATHVGGIVEHSFRRIKDISPPSLNDHIDLSADRSQAQFENDARSGPALVETELKKKYWRVTLAPWLHAWDTDSGINSMPRILSATRGQLVQIPKSEVSDLGNIVTEIVVEDGAVVDLHVGSVKPYDPLRDDVTIFLEEEACKALKVGMGLGGIWAQLLWKSDLEAGEGTGREPESAPETVRRYWYMQDLLSNLPSYHTV